MIKKLFGFFGRKKRVARKMAELNCLIGSLDADTKEYYAFEVAESVATAANDKVLEEIADFYIMWVKWFLNNRQQVLN